MNLFLVLICPRWSQQQDSSLSEVHEAASCLSSTELHQMMLMMMMMMISTITILSLPVFSSSSVSVSVCVMTCAAAVTRDQAVAVVRFAHLWSGEQTQGPPADQEEPVELQGPQQSGPQVTLPGGHQGHGEQRHGGVPATQVIG